MTQPRGVINTVKLTKNTIKKLILQEANNIDNPIYDDIVSNTMADIEKHMEPDDEVMSQRHRAHDAKEWKPGKSGNRDRTIWGNLYRAKGAVRELAKTIGGADPNTGLLDTINYEIAEINKFIDLALSDLE